jgi:hypothetical protein
LLISSYFTTIPDGWPGGRVLEETKLMLTQPSLVDLGLGLSLAIFLIAMSGLENIINQYQVLA